MFDLNASPRNQPDSAGSTPALFPPPPGIDADWWERIETARRVREETRKARGDMPLTLDTRGPRVRFWL